MKDPKNFKFPKALLDQIGECSNGYFLSIINSDGEFEIYFQYDTPVTELAMLNFLDIQSGANMAYVRKKMLNDALEDDGRSDDDFFGKDEDEDDEDPDGPSLS